MIQTSVSVDIEGALAKLAYVREDVADKAVTRALNKTAAQTRTEASKQIRAAGYNLKASVIKQAISIDRATAAQVRASVRAIGKPIPIINYDARPVQNGVTVAVKNGRKLLPGAWLLTLPGGHRGVFERDPRKTPRRVKYQKDGKWTSKVLPIREVYGPSIPAAFLNATVQAALIAAIREKFPRILKGEINYARLKN